MDQTILDQIHRFFDWSAKKVKVHYAERGEIRFHEREIWWANLGENIGSEANGKNFNFERPIIVLKKFSSDMMLAVPCTTRPKDGSWYFPFIFERGERRAVMAQIRTISCKRLIRRMGNMASEDFLALQNAFIAFIKTDPSTFVVGSSGSSLDDNVSKIYPK